MAESSLEPHPYSSEAEVAGLEQRVQRLEDAVAALQDTTLIEKRVLERMRDRPQVKVGPAPADTAAPVPAPAPAPAPQAPQPAPPLSSLGEFRAMVRMFFDMHYHVAWTTRILVLLLIPAICTSEWWFLPAHVPGIGFIFDKIFDIILAFILYRVLASEARRYVQHQALRPPGE